MAHCPVLSGLATGAQGAFKTFGKTKLYVTGPATATIGVLAFPDIFGYESGRAKADADSMGSLGYAVVLVDVVDGDYLQRNDLNLNVSAWLAKHAYESEAVLHVQDAVEYLKTQAHVEQLVSYGYSFGAWIGAKFAAEANAGLLGHVSFCPSWMGEHLLDSDDAVQAFADTLKAPQLLVLSGDEPMVLRENGPVHKLLAAREDGSTVVDFAQMKHGFVARGDVDGDADVKDAVMHAWHLAVKFVQTAGPLG